MTIYGKQHSDGSRSGGQPVSEPEWIEHDGSAVCPVPAGHDVESESHSVVFQSHSVVFRAKADAHGWKYVQRYRDWTAWEQQPASKTDDVPPDVMEVLRAAAATFRTYERLHRAKGTIAAFEKAETNAAMAHRIEAVIAAHEPEPLDPLRAMMDDAYRFAAAQDGDLLDNLTAELRARGVTAPQAQDNRP